MAARWQGHRLSFILSCGKAIVRLAVIALTFLATMLVGFTPVSGQPRALEAVRMQVVGTTSEISIYVAAERGYFADVGISPEFVHLDSAARAVPALSIIEATSVT
jgi:ABC-type nitrate/sulfonate/bicarbonate transport system substrate-binding protein